MNINILRNCFGNHCVIFLFTCWANITISQPKLNLGVSASYLQDLSDWNGPFFEMSGNAWQNTVICPNASFTAGLGLQYNFNKNFRLDFDIHLVRRFLRRYSIDIYTKGSGGFTYALVELPIAITKIIPVNDHSRIWIKLGTGVNWNPIKQTVISSRISRSFSPPYDKEEISLLLIRSKIFTPIICTEIGMESYFKSRSRIFMGFTASAQLIGSVRYRSYINIQSNSFSYFEDELGPVMKLGAVGFKIGFFPSWRASD